MEVMPGYKQTEVGLVPVEWDVAVLSGSASFRTGPFGSALHKSDYTEDGVPVINPMHIIAGRISPTRSMTVSTSVALRLADFLLQPGDIIVGRRGEMGRCAVVRANEHGWLCGSGSMIVRPHGFNSDYLQRLLSSSPVVSAIEEGSVGVTMINLNQGTLGRLRLPLPPLHEQRAIAAALTDVDDLLTSLDRLIAKKRAIKQGVMHDLLTGRKRLPGFSGEWEVRRLGDHLRVLRNGVNSRAELQDEGEIRYLHYGDIHGHTTHHLNPANLPFLPTYKAASLDKLSTGDLVFADASEDLMGVGKSVEILPCDDTSVVSGQHTIALRFDKTILADGFKGLLQFVPEFLAHLRRHAAGTKVLATNRAFIMSAEVLLPPPTEQAAIATLISELETEITALQARRDKTHAIKQAMMHELLTGRTRLI